MPLAVAFLLAFKTIRWRDIFLSAGLLLLIYAPYICWEIANSFGDVAILLNNLHKPSVLNDQAYRFYLAYFRPYVTIPSDLFNNHVLK